MLQAWPSATRQRYLFTLLLSPRARAFDFSAQVVRILRMLFAAPLLARAVVWAGARFGRQSRAITDASKDPIRVAD